MPSTFLLIILISLFQALEIFCQNLQTYKLLPSNSYNLSITNPPEKTYFLIGKQKEYPEIKYNDSKGEWSSSVSIYSITQYFLQAPNLFIDTSHKTDTISFSICSFDPLTSSYNLSLLNKDPEECDPRCSIYGKKCDKGVCICKEGYFGSSCQIKYYMIYSDYSKSFKSLPYSLTFFKIKSNTNIFFEDKQKSTHVFLANDNYFPSFFEFDDYRTPKKSVDSESFNVFTVFCAADHRCSFKVSSETRDLFLARDLIIGISVVVGAIFLIVIVRCK